MMCVIRENKDVRAARRLRVGVRGSGGFTLIEVLMAAFVLGLGVLGLAAMFAGAASQQQLASQKTRSTSVRQSAEAIISENIGKLGTREDADLVDTRIAGETVHEGQWFVIPVKFENAGGGQPPVSYLSINPDEDWTSKDQLFFRMKPNRQLPSALFQAIPDATGYRVGADDADGRINGLDDPFSFPGAPPFDPSFEAVRVLADSVEIRVETTAFGGCEPVQGLYRIDLPEVRAMTFAHFDLGTIDDLQWLSGSDGASYMQIETQRDVKDSDFVGDPLSTAGIVPEEMVLKDLLGGLADVNCDGATDYVETQDPGGIPIYSSVFSADGFAEIGTTVGPGGSKYLLQPDQVTARLTQFHDSTVSSGSRVFASGGGPFSFTDTGQPEVARVKAINADHRFVSAIWLESFEYKGHRLVSMADRVWYTPDPSRPNGRRPDVAYSLLYRDMGVAGGAQYMVVTYALRSSGTSGEYLPPEREEDIASNESPLRLAKGVRMAYDDELGKYYIEAAKNSFNEWIVTPDQLLIFAGDAEASKPYPGADQAVRVQFRREVNGLIRGYLNNQPRAGLRSLLGLVAGSPTDTSGASFNIWGVQQAVTSLDDSEWGLRPLEALKNDVFAN